MKRNLYILVAVLLLVPGSLLAASTLPTPTPVPGPVASALQSAHLNRLKTRGASEIDRRLASLQAALTKVQSSAKLSAADAQTLTKQLQDELTGLTNLKTKLAAETSLDAARTDVQNIIADYRVYGLMLPKARLVATADRAAVTGAKFQQLATKLQEKVKAAKDQGKDVTGLQQRVGTMKARLISAQDKYDGLVAKVINLQPSDYNANHKLLADNREVMKSIRADFSAAHDEAQAIILGLKNLK